MSVGTPEELEALRRVGRVVAEAIREMRRRVIPGITTGELDAVCAEVFRRHGARSGPQLDYGFPGTSCISVNDEAVHGIPGRRRLCSGDLVKLDVTAELEGFYADACVAVPVGRPVADAQRVVRASRDGLAHGMAAARAGAPLNAIGAAVTRAVTGRGCAVCSDLIGHGIGRRIHEAPQVPNMAIPGLSGTLTPGLVITIEPIVSAGSGHVRQGGDGWTIVTADGALSAHAEHTIVVTDGRPIVLTV